MTSTKGITDGPKRQTEMTLRRRGTGIILAVFSILFLMGTSAAHRAQAKTFTLLHSFSGSDGMVPRARLVKDSSGNLYGTTFLGGSSNMGTVFKVDTSGKLTVLHNFSGGTDEGQFPVGDLVIDSSGILYGTTAEGGASTNCSYPNGTKGCGTVFKLDTSGGSFALLHSFSGTDGQRPTADLMMDSSGTLYGTTQEGGASTNCSNPDGTKGCGTVFKLDTSGAGFAVLHSFTGGTSDGAAPRQGLVMDSSGNLYGTTYVGGPSNKGTVFKLDTSGSSFALLHGFAGGTSDGANPWADLMMDSSGTLYGTTFAGGSSNCSNPDGTKGCGTVFKLDTSGADFTVLHSFTGGTSDGANTWGSLVMDSSGTLYGTTIIGGSSNMGTVFKLDTSGADFAILHSFSGSDGTNPLASLLIDSYGTLYGTTKGGGSSNKGTVFEITTTPQGAAQVIINQVNSLLAQGLINKGQHNSLVKKLQHAIRMINARKIHGAIGNLEGFIGHVNGLENSRRLTGAQGSALTTAAKDVIAQLI